MKKIFALIALTALCFTARAQTNQTFIGTAESYFTSFNTNYSWVSNSLEIATGYKQVTGVNAASTLDGQYDFERFNIGAGLQFSGVGSPINGAVVQGGYALIEHLDLKVDADIRAGYDWNRNTVEPTLFLSKKPTPNTFFRIGASLPFYFKGKQNTNPTFYAETGFTY